MPSVASAHDTGPTVAVIVEDPGVNNAEGADNIQGGK
jgi:hypothetical protein